ncbi:tetratricopeptide repeat protein 1 [Hippocampus zosterae]|uniref:tetratricopeptide repeat protein 1 n=1 Tax=Hippocampus zosterae TaxID=109293 RepID=UPI00223D3094|nr:tetratricopeptide repeat protein 1 [Hippocampus zosterae]
MSRQAAEQKRSEEDSAEREDFFDCQETLEHPDRGDRDGRRPNADLRHRPTDDTSTEPAGDDSDDDSKDFGGEVAEDDHQEEEEENLTEAEMESRRLESLTLKEEGNRHFKNGDWSPAEQSYTQALRLCPRPFSRERAVLFSNRAAARLHLERKDDGIADCSRALELNPDYVKALLRRAELYEQTEQLEKALDDYQAVLERDPEQTAARRACARLPQQIHEKNEKLKAEMLGKLKDLGNLVLRPFGLSTNNFQVNQDAATGSYSINFVNKAGDT